MPVLPNTFTVDQVGQAVVTAIAFSPNMLASANPPLATIQKFAEIDLQAARQFGSTPNRKLLKMAASDKKKLTAFDVYQAGELMVESVKKLSPDKYAAANFLINAQGHATAVAAPISEFGGGPTIGIAAAKPESKFAKGHDDGFAATQRVIADTKLVAGFVVGVGDNIEQHLVGYTQELGGYIAAKWQEYMAPHQASAPAAKNGNPRPGS